MIVYHNLHVSHLKSVDLRSPMAMCWYLSGVEQRGLPVTIFILVSQSPSHDRWQLHSNGLDSRLLQTRENIVMVQLRKNVCIVTLTNYRNQQNHAYTITIELQYNFSVVHGLVDHGVDRRFGRSSFNHQFLANFTFNIFIS